MISQYIKVFSKALGYIVAPFIVFVGVFILLYVLFAGNILSFNLFSIVSFVFFIITLIVFIYISFRVSFIYMILLDKKDILVFDTAKDVVNTSRNITRGIIVFPFLLLALAF